MRKNIISLILSILCCYPLASGNQPNVVLIISDDAGYADFGFMNEVTGNTTDILTPELDTLRSQGSLCSVAYTGAVCSPSRGSILTGSYQQRVGYFYNINNALDPADGPDGFANNEVIAFERMKSAGYKTLAIGKWHVGAQADTLNATGNKVVIPGNRPPRQGVDHFFGMLSGSRDYDVPMDDHAFGSYEYRQRGLREMSPGNKDDSLANDVDEEQNSKWAGDVTDAFGLRAREYVTEHANQDYPFFLYVAFNAPHTPMYESSDYDLLNNPNHPNYANFNSMSTVRKKYCSMVYTMDKNIGLLMDRLKDPNNDGNTSDSVYDNTLIIFINDNGGSKKNESVNLPLRGDKGDPHDGGCRVPMLMTGPGISGDSIYDKPIHSMDLIPTMLAHGGNSIPTELMGSNLLDRVKETDSSDPHDYICVAGNNGLGLRKGDWKLVIGTNGVQTLFNTSSDVGEANDLAGDEPAKLDELIKDATNFDVQMDKPRFPSKGSSHETLNYNYSFTFAPNEVTTPSGVDKILIDYDDGDANNGEHDSAVNNGGFESNTATSGNQGKFNQINQWTNLASNGQNINAIRDNNTSPNGGGWNAVLSDANPASKDFGIDTGHSLTAGENFTVDYAWLDASSWVDSDKIRFQLFTTNDNAITGTQNIIHTEDSSSSTNLAYKTENFTFTAPSGVDGKTLFLRFFALDGNASTGFARVDNIFVGRLGSDQTQTEPQFWAGSDQWQDPSSASDTLLVTDSCALSTLVFPAESNFDYIAQNNLTRYTGLEFIQNTLSFTGNGSNSGKTAKISGNDIILAENYTNDTPPSINFNGDGDGYTFDLALDILLYHDTVIEGDGTATYLISGELKDYDNAVSLTKNGSSTLTLAHDATYSGNTIINGGMLEINPGITLAGSPQVQVSAGASLSGNGSVSGNVVGTGTLAPGQSIGTLAIAGDAQAGTLLIEIAANDADRMNVAGALDVSSMNLEITSLATPAQDTYIIASYGTLNGTFASITGVPNDYQILYTYDDSGSTNHIALAKINNVPNIDAIADQGNTTLDSVNLQASASDDDTADTLTFSATGLPAGLLINPSTGLISGTISSGAETGSAYSVVVTVTDNGSPAQSAEASFTWDVVAFNNAPTITPITTQANITKDVVSLPVNASDDVGDTLTYSASGLPSGLSINNASGLIFGTISDSAADASPYSITVIVTDNGSPTKNAQTSFAWNVTAFNNAPTITAISDQTGITKDVISLSVSASDSDGDTLSYIATGLPSGLSIDSSTGLISGTISDDAGDNSSYSVTIIVTDDGAKSAQASFTWNVSTFNNAPTITAISDQTNITKDVVSIQVSALDSDDDTLSYIATGLPSGLSIDSSTGLISGTISDDAGDNSSYSVTITVTDDRAKSAQALFTWNVSTFNNAPTITAISDQTGITKDVISLQVSANDSDGDDLSYTATGLPSGLSIDSSTGLISGTISDDAGDNSSYSVTIIVTDDGAKSAQALFTWNVSTFNNAPTITAISDQTGITKDVVSIQVSALDSDDDTLSYIATGLPSGLSIDSSTGLISGTISDDAGDNSSYSVTIIVTDDGAKSAQASFTWNVSTFNNAPTITAISDQTNITKDVVSIQVSALDSDDDTLSYIATGLPSGLSIDSSTGLISGTISDDAGDNSSYSVTITVTDDGAKSAQASFTWNVSTFNNAPTITAISDQTGITKDVISLQVSALDSDDDTLSYIATGLPSGLSIDSSTGLISGTISDDAGDNSSYSVTIIVTDDGAKSAQASFTWNVSTFNNAPTITAISDQTGITKDVVSIQVSALDSDDDTLSYIATGLPSGLSIDSSTGLISGTISDDAGDNSSYSVTVTVTDDRAKSAQALFTWNVSTFNNAPTITAISDQTDTTKDVISLQVSAADSDGDTLSYSATELPAGLSINPSTGVISGTISSGAETGSAYSVVVTVTDNGSPAQSAEASFTWDVVAFNNAPTITPITTQASITKDVVSLPVNASDDVGDTLSYSATELPAGLLINPSTGLISGTISSGAETGSAYSVVVTVTDNGSPAQSAEASFTWNVTAFNNAPTITAISDQTNITKDVVSIQVSALDSDDDTLSYSATGLPSELSIDSSSGLISGTLSDAANYNVTVTVTDNRAPGKNAQTSFAWNVTAFNNAPTITAISDQANITKDVVSIQVSALDSDDDTLSYSATGLPSGLSIDSSTGLISGTISDDANVSNPYSITITVTDNGSPSKNAETSFTWLVNSPPDTTAPTADLASPANGNSIDPAVLNAQGYLEVSFSDVGDGLDASTIDGNELSLSGTGLGTTTLVGDTPTLVSGTTYRYGFTGEFVKGSVNVDFVAGSFADLAETQNVNISETESFDVEAPPAPPVVQIIDDKDTGFTTTGSWLVYGKGYKDNVTYIGSGSGENVASWSFTGLAPGNYEVSVTWLKGNKRTSVKYKVFDNITQVGETITVDQSPPTAADHIEEGSNFQIISNSVAISSGTLVLQLSDNAAGDFVVADAVRIELLSPLGVDTTPPIADLASPANGNSIDPAVLNAQGYLEVSFSDVGDGLDASTIDGNELSLSGTGLGTTTLVGDTPTLVSGTTYRYGFTGEFVKGSVNVDFVAGSFADLAETQNVNISETESFDVEAPPAPPVVQIIDDKDTGFTTTGSWLVYGKGYKDNVTYIGSGSGENVASWSFTGLAPGNYEVSVTWLKGNKRTSVKYKVFDNITQVGETITVDQSPPTAADHIEEGSNFQIISNSVAISSGTLVLQLSDNAAGDFVVADAVRIELLSPLGVDTTPPIADLASPANGNSIDPAVLNAQGYLEVSFSDVGDGLDASTIDGNELSLSGTGLGTTTLVGDTPTLVSGTTYRYGFTGEFVKGSVNVDFVAGSFADLAETQNVNISETESFDVEAPPAPPVVQIIDDKDTGFTTTGSWLVYGKGYKDNVTYIGSGSGENVASWSFTGLAPGNYEVSVTWLKGNKRTSVKYKVFDNITQVGETITVDQSPPTAADHIEEGSNFQIISNSVAISSGTLVLQLSDNAAGDFVVADAVRIELLSPLGVDTTPPIADLASPANGNSIDPAVLNAQGYLEVSFSDVGDGLDASTIDGNELSLSGTGLGTTTLVGDTPTLVSGTTYRYGFTGEFVKGSVNVDFVAGSFADLAETQNVNISETESFDVEAPPAPPVVQIIDDKDTGFTTTGSWLVYGKGYKDNVTYIGSGSGENVASWSFTGLAPGNYEVSVTWLKGNKRTSVKYKVFDNITQVGETITVDQSPPTAADHIEEGSNFQIISNSVAISSGTLVLQLSDNAAGDFVVADAVRIELLSPLGVDTTPPIADLASPANGNSIDPAVLNAQGYLEVSFSDVGDGLDASTIDGNELSLSGTGLGTTTLVGDTPTLVSGTTYRYGFTGEFVKGSVNVDFVAGSFADLAETQNVNISETESFDVEAPPAPPVVQIIDDKDTGFTTTGSWLVYGKGYKDNVTYIGSGSGENVASWSFTGLAPGNYEVSVTWLKGNKRTSVKYKVFDNITQVGETITVDQSPPTAADHIEEGSNFQIISNSVAISSGTLVLQLSDNAAGDFVVADAVRIEKLAPELISVTAKSSISKNNSTNTNESYQLISRSLASKVADMATSHLRTDSNSTNNPTDLFPDNPELTTLSDYINYIADYIADDNVIFAEDWKEQDHNTQFTADLETILELVFAAEAAEAADQAAFFYLQAFERVDEKLIPRTDGFQEGGSHETDWIIIKEAQDIVYPDLLLLSEYLWLSTR